MAWPSLAASVQGDAEPSAAQAAHPEAAHPEAALEEEELPTVKDRIWAATR